MTKSKTSTPSSAAIEQRILESVDDAAAMGARFPLI